MSELTVSQQVERSLVSAMLQDQRAVWQVLDIVDSTDFEHIPEQNVFDAIVALAGSGKPSDAVSVSDYLAQHDHGKAKSVFVWEVASFATTWANAAYFAERVRQAATVRRVRDAATRIIGNAAAGGDPEQELAAARRLLDEADEGARPRVKYVGEILPEVIESLDRPPRYFPTPWRELDRKIGGFAPGTMNVIAARPGAGKTMFALQSAVELCQHGPVAFASLEMGAKSLMKRLVSMEARVPMSAVFASRLTAADFEAVAAARSRIAALPLAISDEFEHSLDNIYAFAKSVQRDKGHLAALIIDYMQLLPNTSGRPRWEAVGEHSRRIKIMSRQLDCPIIALSQLNRESEKLRRLPTLADLRESGSIEQDADTVIMLQRRVDEDDEPTGELDVVVAKNRHGQMGRFTLDIDGEYMRFSSPVPTFQGAALAPVFEKE